MIRIIFFLAIVRRFDGVTIGHDCGLDGEERVFVKEVTIETYPWYGVLYYTYRAEGEEETRAVTPVVLLQAEFVLAAAADLGPMPKLDFRDKARVLLGVDWGDAGRAVKSYVIHPEYGPTVNTLAIVQIATPVTESHIKPVCPPPEHIRNPEFYVLRFEDDDYNVLRKRVIPVAHVPGDLCKNFYLRANLYAKKMRPPHVTCALEEGARAPCVWTAGAALAMRDTWGRWQLLGFGVRGPGCGAPARFLDMMSYQPWVQETLEKYRPITISRLDDRTVVFRQGADNVDFRQFGDCVSSETTQKMLYRDFMVLRSSTPKVKRFHYALRIDQKVTISCLRVEVIDGSLKARLDFKHVCPRKDFDQACYDYKETQSMVKMTVHFQASVAFEVVAFGTPAPSFRLIDKQIWKWEEGSFYPDFSPNTEELRPSADDSYFGFDPLVSKSKYDDQLVREMQGNLTRPDLLAGDPTAAAREREATKTELRETALKRNEEMYKHPYGYFYRGPNREYRPVYFEFDYPGIGRWKQYQAFGWFHRFLNGTRYPAPPGEPEYETFNYTDILKWWDRDVEK